MTDERGGNTILRVKDLFLELRSGKHITPILKGISFELREGEILGILGESGSGKSMTVNTICGLIPEKSSNIRGKIYVDGEEILGMKRKKRRKYVSSHTAVILQDAINALSPYDKIGGQLRDTARLYSPGASQKELDEQIDLRLQQMGLPGLGQAGGRYPYEFSGGMRQRIAIAMALLSPGKMLIADEPTTSLDGINQQKCVDLLRRIHDEQQKTVIYISHNLGLIAGFCDYVLVMKDGNIVEQGKTEKVLNEPEHPYTRELVGCTRRLYEYAGELPENGISDTSVVQDGEKELLQVSHLKKSYIKVSAFRDKETVHAVKDVSFGIGHGEIVGVVGESGCGKSTAARLITCLLQADEGTIRFEGSQLNGKKEKELREVRPGFQMIQQNPFSGMNPRLTLRQSLIAPLKYHKIGADVQERQQILERLFSECGLKPEYLDRYPGQLSGGQLQRACIARSLSMDPKLLIADEVVSALDVAVQEQILELLLQLRKQRQMGILFISHDLAVVRRIADRILVMKDGMIVEENTVSELFSHPQHPYTQQLLGSMVRLGEK